MTKKRWMSQVSEIESVHEVVEMVASVIDNRKMRAEGIAGLTREQLFALAGALMAAAEGQLEPAKDALNDALRGP